MERSDRRGLGLALAGHLALFAALTIGIAHRKPPTHVEAAPIDVQLVDAVGLQSAAPTPATEAPREQQAPDSGPPEEAAPAPQPVPTPPAPKPTPPPPQPAPKPEPKPAPEPPAPKPAPAPKPKPAPPKPVAPTPAPEKAAPKHEKAKEAPKKEAAAAPRLSTSDLMRDLKADARAENRASGEGHGRKSTGSRLGSDFLKGIANPSPGKGASARAAVSGPALNGLAAAIKRQVQPCYELGSLAGTPAMQIVTVLHLRFNRDGSIAGTPQVADQTGVTDANRGYRQQMAELSRRAVMRCAPLKLPADLYQGGWEEIEMGFIPGQMQ